MANSRDNFKKLTIDILAKRVGSLCSNPKCRTLTIGANEKENKVTSIGEAAHITGASIGGPRYDENLTPEERSNINNGIWLCSNCATLIDKDEVKYTVGILQKWKEDAENETRRKLNGEFSNSPIGIPYIEADLISISSMRSVMGYSQKNPKEFHDGREVTIIGIGTKPITHWRLKWYFNFTLYNNSNYPAYNVSVESVGREPFSYLDILPKINNIDRLEYINLQAKYELEIESDYTVADSMIMNIPDKFNDFLLKIIYFDDPRREHTTYVEFIDGNILNKKA